jgi:hypothetical protein
VIEGEDVPAPLPGLKLLAEVPGDPELGTIELDVSVAPLVDPEGVVETAEVSVLPAVMVLRRMVVEVALAEHGARAGLDDGGLHAPGGV